MIVSTADPSGERQPNPVPSFEPVKHAPYFKVHVVLIMYKLISGKI